MIKHGYANCSPCHADPSGGELLTAYGRAMSDAFLSTQWPEGETAADGATSETERPPAYAPFWGLFELPEEVLVGGSFRLASLYRPSLDDDELRAFPMQLDLYGNARIMKHLIVAGSIGLAKVPAGSPNARAAQLTTNQGDGYNLISRTHYLGWSFGQGEAELRVGRLNLPFGLRMSEHVMWVREQTQTDRESDQQHGAALYMEFEGGRFEAMAIAGNYQVNPDRLRERGYSAYAEFYPWQGAALGAGTLFTVAGDDRLSPMRKRNIRQVNGLTARIALNEMFVVMAEGDVLFRSRRNTGSVGFVQLDAEPLRGLHLIGTFEGFDAGSSEKDDEPLAPGRGETKLGGWFGVQWFPLPHFDVRVDAIVRQDEPFQLLSQIHIYP